MQYQRASNLTVHYNSQTCCVCCILSLHYRHLFCITGICSALRTRSPALPSLYPALAVRRQQILGGLSNQVADICSSVPHWLVIGEITGGVTLGGTAEVDH